MRRLPVYLLLDTSGSMSGEPVNALKNGVQLLASTLRQDPYALETVFVSVITFNTEAEQVVPLTDLITFQPPEINASGITSLGAALKLLSQKIKNEVAKTTPEKKGDWKPLVFIMTDGAPTDDWKSGLEELKQIKTGMIISCAAGEGAKIDVLKQISEIVVSLDTATSETIQQFFKWISASICTTSQKVDLTKKEITKLDELPPPPPEVNIVT
ncbi:tellurium resistance protein [Desulfamplus magnetovallimortis]|uniref:Tellurium resistance protein n=1 Tax=Desulfamplus magnetovallimortis TaxID=1246637 RepID=A0A1W1HA88_9BACT|nr:VWA domain-containing protein [Desulfamplus magnetovallimortis]SLM29414.1 tellurium resistance protein [Desulfamplus magnetovallimortis]